MELLTLKVGKFGFRAAGTAPSLNVNNSVTKNDEQHLSGNRLRKMLRISDCRGSSCH